MKIPRYYWNEVLRCFFSLRVNLPIIVFPSSKQDRHVFLHLRFFEASQKKVVMMKTSWMKSKVKRRKLFCFCLILAWGLFFWSENSIQIILSLWLQQGRLGSWKNFNFNTVGEWWRLPRGSNLRPALHMASNSPLLCFAGFLNALV